MGRGGALVGARRAQHGMAWVQGLGRMQGAGCREERAVAVECGRVRWRGGGQGEVGR